MDVLEIMRKKMPISEASISKEISLADFANYWIDYRATNIVESTEYSYRSIITNHIARVFQSRKLVDITAEDVQLFVNSLDDGIDLDDPLSAKTIRNIHGVLHKCLQTAVEMKIINENPAQNTALPKMKKTEIVPLDNAQLQDFLTATVGHPLEALFKLAVFTGLRKAELLGLTRDCFNFSEGYIHVYRQLSYDKIKRRYYFSPVKNGKPRYIYPPSKVMEMMERYLTSAKDSIFVFCSDKGEHLRLSQIRKPFEKIVNNLAFNEFRFHDLRHTYAVLSIQAGVDMKTLSEQMGHYSVAFTLDTYAFALTDMKKDGAKKMQAFIDSLNIEV